MSKLLNKRNFFFILIIFFITLFFEIIFFLYFHNNNLKEKLSLYSEKRKSALSHDYFPQVDLVLPYPNTNFTHITSEFVDVFPTKDVLNLGFGLFDDGINKGKKVYAVAIGDSFTRGVGSGNNLKNGWVELVEKKVDWVDILNLGNLGGSITNQKFKYNNLKEFINHDLVIYNFFFEDDIIENLTDYDGSFYISYLKEKLNLNDEQVKQKIDELNIYHGYKPHLEYFMNNKVKSFTVGFVFKLIELLKIKQIIPEHRLPDFLTGSSDTYRDYLNTRMKIIPEKIFNLRDKFGARENFEPEGAQKPIRWSFDINDKHFSLYKELKNTVLMEKLIQNSTNLVNNFYEEVKSDIKHKGAKFILILQPSQNSVYFPILKNEIPDDKFVDYISLKNTFKNNLNKEILILDLSEEIRKEVKKNPNISLYWKYDGHFNIEGYRLVSEIVSNYLISIDNFQFKIE